MLRNVQTAWGELEPPVLRFVLKVVLVVGFALATPFLLLALVFLLLDWHILWVLVPAAMAALLVVMALILWAIVRAKIRQVRARIEQAASVEQAFRGGPR